MSDTSVDSLVSLQERMVNLIKQLNMPLVEVSMVIQNMISPMLESLKTHALENEIQIPEKIINDIRLPIPLSVICSPSHIKNIVPATIVGNV